MNKNETKSTIIKLIKHIIGDGQFECITKHMEMHRININITGRDEPVPEVERYIRTVKERMRAIVNTLPFEILPHQLIVQKVYNGMF